MSKITGFQKKVLDLLSGKINDFYLVGGTALSLYYFHHRQSLDLDFFTTEFSTKRIEEIIGFLSSALKRKINIIAKQEQKNKVRVAVYSIPIARLEVLKIDFVEDYMGLIKPPKLINGINVASLEDIYLKKISAVSGTSEIEDATGRMVSRGNRQEAKDFLDLYCLSHTFMRLSEFVFKFCKPAIREGIIRWFRTYSRMEMKTGFMELELKKAVDYNDIEQHFKKEIKAILEKEVGAI
jgi:predicted nucleotidyltransferase component of viral defense system